MQIQFEYKPFDRVTVNLYGEDLRAVLSDRCGKHLSGAYADSFGLNDFTCDAHRVRPGHYDKDGNWLPYPGEPCYYISADGEPIQMMVFSVTGELVTVLDQVALYRNFYKLFGDKAVETHFFNGEDFGHDIPKTALLYPGRIKTSQQ